MNTIKILLISLILSISSSVISQYNFDFGVKLGMANYLGDIGGKEQTARRFIWDMKLNQTNFAAGAYARYKFNGLYGLNVSINYGKLSGDDIDSENRARNARNLRFKNNVFNLSIENELYLFELNDVGGSGRYWVDMKAYVFGGLSVFIHNPKGQIDGDSEWYELQPLQTEGIAYKKAGLGIPAGVGLYFTYKRQHRFGWNISWTTTFTDYIDDISTVYADPATLQSDLAAQLANQSELSSEADDEVFLQNFITGEKRGDQEYNDSFMFTTFSYGYLIRGSPSFYKQNYGFLKGKKKSVRKVRAKF
ncbi:MAG: hypothetical protein ACI8Q1_001209 [Parvicella sp.]|jgi:hypothetical protein